MPSTARTNASKDQKKHEQMPYRPKHSQTNPPSKTQLKTPKSTSAIVDDGHLTRSWDYPFPPTWDDASASSNPYLQYAPTVYLYRPDHLYPGQTMATDLMFVGTWISIDVPTSIDTSKILVESSMQNYGNSMNYGLTSLQQWEEANEEQGPWNVKSFSAPTNNLKDAKDDGSENGQGCDGWSVVTYSGDAYDCEYTTTDSSTGIS